MALHHRNEDFCLLEEWRGKSLGKKVLILQISGVHIQRLGYISKCPKGSYNLITQILITKLSKVCQLYGYNTPFLPLFPLSSSTRLVMHTSLAVSFSTPTQNTITVTWWEAVSWEICVRHQVCIYKALTINKASSPFPHCIPI